MKRNELAVTPSETIMIAQRAPTPVGSRDIHPCWHSHPARGPMVRARSARQGLIAGLLIGPCRPESSPGRV
ncbi:hypothetical protein KURONO_3367 [Mycobacterium tuberculosis str. Kurono]|nr:hypothetical protein KURONO_3367 [Mycobacterium tuberculosis str. Kurono]